MNKIEKKKKLDSILAKQDVANFESSLNRARSVTVGTAFGGVTEVTMRSQEGYVIWAPMQPVEIIELIHQLAANVGCHIHIQPRNDFSSWRDWRVTPEEKNHLNGWAPFVNDMAPHNQVGANLPSPEQQPGLKLPTKARSTQNEAMATEKPKNRRNTQRAAKTA